MKKMNLSDLKVTSFTTSSKAVKGGATYQCGTNFFNCDTAEFCDTDLTPCTQQANCTGNCTYLC